LGNIWKGMVLVYLKDFSGLLGKDRENTIENLSR
jgi:hypothetical protein